MMYYLFYFSAEKLLERKDRFANRSPGPTAAHAIAAASVDAEKSFKHMSEALRLPLGLM